MLWTSLPIAAASILAAAQQTKPLAIHSAGNPILSDGSFYSADPAMIAVGDTLYILTGRDLAPPDVNDFIMPEWELWATKDAASKQWQFYLGFLRPEQVFARVAPGHADAGQIVQGSDKRFNLYAPFVEANSSNVDPIGLAVADSVLGL